MDRHEHERERRRQTRLEHLGTNDPTCPCCGERDDRCFHKHHIAGRQFDAVTTIPICSNCHAKVTDMQKDHPKGIDSPPSLDERLAHFLLGIAEFLELIVEKLREFANDLIDRLRHRRAATPDWVSE